MGSLPDAPARLGRDDRPHRIARIARTAGTAGGETASEDRRNRRKGPVPSSSVVLHLTLESGSQLRGVLVSDDGVGPLPFSGWFGLVEAVQLCRREQTPDPVDPRPSAPARPDPRR